MSHNESSEAPSMQFAPLRNVLLARGLMEILVTRDAELPGMGVLYGPSGWGKTKAVSSVAVHYRAVYVQIRSHFTAKALLLAVLAEMSVKPARTVSEMADQVCDQLMHASRPLILDDMDYAVKRKLVDLVRDLYEGSGAAILMVGEENFPREILRNERFHNRILKFQPAEPANLDDARKCVKLYCPDVAVGDDWLKACLSATRGTTRRLCTNLAEARREAKKTGAKLIDVKWWGSRPFNTGEAPMRRAA